MRVLIDFTGVIMISWAFKRIIISGGKNLKKEDYSNVAASRFQNFKMLCLTKTIINSVVPTVLRQFLNLLLFNP